MALLVADVLRHAARYTPNRLAATLGDDEVTFGALDKQASRIAHTMGGMGVGHGDRVAWWGDTSLEALPIFFALAKLGAAGVAARLAALGRGRDALADGTDSAAAEAAPSAGGIDRARRMGCAAALPIQPRAGDDAADQGRLAGYRTALDSAARA